MISKSIHDMFCDLTPEGTLPLGANYKYYTTMLACKIFKQQSVPAKNKLGRYHY